MNVQSVANSFAILLPMGYESRWTNNKDISSKIFFEPFLDTVYRAESSHNRTPGIAKLRVNGGPQKIRDVYIWL